MSVLRIQKVRIRSSSKTKSMPALRHLLDEHQAARTGLRRIGDGDLEARLAPVTPQFHAIGGAFGRRTRRQKGDTNGGQRRPCAEPAPRGRYRPAYT
jgi:hypothetical protein